MARNAIPPTLLVLALTCLLASPLAAAEDVASGQIVAKALELHKTATQEGDMEFLHISQGPRLGPLHVTFAGKRIEATQYNDNGVETSVGNFNTLRALNPIRPNQGQSFSAESARGRSTAVHGETTLNIFTADGPDGFQATLSEGRQVVLNNPRLAPGRIQEASGDPSGNPVPALPRLGVGPNAPGYWTSHDTKSPHILTETTGAAALRLTGTFTIEVMGLDFQVRGQGVDRTLHSGTEREPLQPGAPDTVHVIRQSFLRITVTDGSLELDVAGAALVQWSGPQVDTTSGAVSIEDATGSITLTNGRQQHLTGTSYRVDGLAAFQANPAQNGMQLTVTGLDTQGQPLEQAGVTLRQETPFGLWLAAGAALLSVGVAALALGLRRLPTMTDVEAALEAGRFRRAAWDAGRLLRHRPGFEDAVLGRAIALSKMGRNRRVIKEVQSHLLAQEPSDGVLHYVLGLAYKSVNAIAEAQTAWREAIRRTPALTPQVQSLLGGEKPSNPPRDVALPVDGTAYV